MSIGTVSGVRELLVESLRVLGMPWPDIRMAELGNQRIKKELDNGLGHILSAKSLFEWLGACHTSFDLNGRDGAVQLDLSEPVPREYHGRFNLVTNFGTSEHVQRNQRQVFHNVHMLCERGGVIVHAVPGSACISRHGFWRYPTEWMFTLARNAGYSVVFADSHTVSDRVEYTRAIMVKCLDQSEFTAWEDPIRFNRHARRQAVRVAVEASVARRPIDAHGEDQGIGDRQQNG